MNLSKTLIDLLGIGFQIYLIMLFFGTFWEMKFLKKRFFVLGFCGVSVWNLLSIQFLHNNVLLAGTFILLVVFLGFYFKNNWINRILFAFLFSSLAMASETVFATILTRLLKLPFEQVQAGTFSYAVGLLGSNLFALVLIQVMRIFFPQKHRPFRNNWLDLIMLFLPLQSILICGLVQSIDSGSDMENVAFLGNIVLVFSFLLIAVAAFLLNNQQKSRAYRQAYETALSRLRTQINHYDELYLAQQELKKARHEMKNETIALLGMLEGHDVEGAIQHIRNKQSLLESTNLVLDTGYPAMDAIVNAKMNVAREHGLKIHYKMLADGQLLVDQFDLAVILANALDNALEAVSKSSNIDTDITVTITNPSNYLSILVENFTSEQVDKNLRTTKKNAANHGFGIAQMKILAAKYDGDLSADFDKDTGKFSLQVLLKNQRV
ncbi:hypothetical protein FACS1894111_00020 [Clostridia bacterium]|nr:hypothetical protein FACS1894111_00020 [Clostridia bacterium]